MLYALKNRINDIGLSSNVSCGAMSVLNGIFLEKNALML